MSSNLPIVVLDTSTVRSVLQNEPQAIRHWPDILFYSSRATFRLSDTAIAELILQLAEGRLYWSNWTGQIHLVDAILDKKLPVEPCNRNLGHVLSGFTHEVIPEDVLARQVWRLLKDCRTLDDLNRACEFLYDGGTMRVQFTPLSQAQKFMGNLRDQWASEFDDSLRLFRVWQTKEPGSITSLDQLVRALSAHLDGERLTDPPMSQKFDAWLRNRAERIWSSARSKDPYNPLSDNNSGDALDDHMLQYLSLPQARILTQDGRFMRRVRQTNTFQGDRVISLQECRDWLVGL